MYKQGVTPLLIDEPLFWGQREWPVTIVFKQLFNRDHSAGMVLIPQKNMPYSVPSIAVVAHF
jgi:hypothetical protein